MTTTNQQTHAIRNPTIDHYLRRGLSLRTLALFNPSTIHSHQGVSNYIKRTEQTKIWENAKEQQEEKIIQEENQEKERRKTIADLLQQITNISVRTEKESLLYEQAKEFFRQTSKPNGYTFTQIYNILEDYYQFQQKNERVPLKWFAEKYDLWQSQVGKIFQKVGLKPSARPNNNKKRSLSLHQKSCLKRTVKIPLPCSDIAHFLNINKYFVTHFFSNYKGEERRPQVKPFIKIFVGGKRNARYQRNVNYQLCSEVYEAIDADFSQEEIKNLYNLEQRVYDFIVDKKPTIALVIQKGLETMFPDQEINNPYKEFTIK